MLVLTLGWRGRFSATLALLAFAAVFHATRVEATDYFLTIGGGYSRTGNQASLEANVVFLQQILTDKHPGPRRHDIYFADGSDPGADLQVLADKPPKGELPATELLAALHRRRSESQITYRNHRVAEIAGALDPDLIRADFDALAKEARRGDRLIVYVTAHGSPGPKDDRFNTTIDCWNNRKIAARDFAEWLNKLPAEVPVVMVMAQCYCGGFAHTIFEKLDEAKGLAPQLRAGFFAQQHDLPAAGCRPDIEHDEEFSSYFWGALAGRSRNGAPIEGDIDDNGVISFAEAYAHAVIAGETVDIPLRTSEVLLRTFSRLTAEKPREAEPKPDGDDPPRQVPATPGAEGELNDKPALATMNGSLQSFVDRSRPVMGRIVTQLAKLQGFALGDDVSVVVQAYDRERRAGRSPGRGRGARQGSGRRDLLKEVTEKWPDLGDERKWVDSPLLKPENQEQLSAELQQLPSWKAFNARVKQQEATSQGADDRELRAVKLRRLINALESIALEKNLPLVATPQIVERFQQMVALEESAFTPPGAAQK